MEKLFNLENDGLNMAADGDFLYVRCKRDMYKFNIDDMRVVAHKNIYKKDGKSRGLAICDGYIFLYDFCDLYILDKTDLSIVEVIRLGTDLSSDLGVMKYLGRKAYIAIRNGGLAVCELDGMNISKHKIADSSFWDYCVTRERIYLGTVRGELIETDADLRVISKIQLCKKNIYSVIPDGETLYTVSQDMTIKAVDTATLEQVGEAKKAVNGMVSILGVYGDNLVIADGRISLWDKKTLLVTSRIDFPASRNNGAFLHGSTVYGTDYKSIYKIDLCKE